MWVKIQKATDNEGDTTIIVPSELNEQWLHKTHVQYGERSIPITVKVDVNLVYNQENNYENPQMIHFSSALIEKLDLIDKITYQISEDNETISLGPIVGFLLGDQQYYYHDRYLQELTISMENYAKIGGLFMAFNHFSVDWDQRVVHGLFYDFELKKWSYGRMPIPMVIYRRGFTYGNRFVERLQQLKGMFLFNEIRFNKWQMYNLLQDHTSFQTYLPETVRYVNADSIKQMIDKYKKIILKPADLSRGRGIIVLEKIKEKIKVRDYRSVVPYFIEENNLQSLLEGENLFKNDYIIQQYINLARISDALWDIRIVMQKDPEHQWRCSGIECRVAGRNRVITNISNGGRALTLKQALLESFEKEIDPEITELEVIRISEQFCKLMDQTGYKFAEFGLDLAIDEEMNFWFIEANVRPTFNGFKTLDMEIYKKICENPVFFASSVAGFKRM